MNDPHHTTTQGPGKHKSNDRNYKSVRIRLATFISLDITISYVICHCMKYLINPVDYLTFTATVITTVYTRVTGAQLAQAV
jgi:hypothetical protein